MSARMKTVHVVAALIMRTGPDGVRQVFATQRGYGDWKDWWEFPGDKIEPGELPRDALCREIREELAAEISAGQALAVIEYDYPDFHLTMECFLCSVVSGTLELLEHENAVWLTAETLRSVKWLPADAQLLDSLEQLLKSS